MANELNTPIDISELPKPLREAAEEVERTKRPRLIKRGDQEIAMLSPVTQPKARSRSRQAADAANPNAWLDGIVGIGASADHAPVAANTDKYAADAIYEQSFRPKK